MVKVLGECEFDLALFAGSTAKAETRIFKLQRCYDKSGSIELEIRASPAGPAADSDDEGKVPEESARAAESHLAPVPAASAFFGLLGSQVAIKEPEERTVPASVVQTDAGKKAGQLLNASFGSQSANALVSGSGLRKSASGAALRGKDQAAVPDPSLNNKDPEELRRMVAGLEQERSRLAKQARTCEQDLQEQIRLNFVEREDSERRIRGLQENLRKLDCVNVDLTDKCGVLDRSLAQEIQASSEMGQQIRALNEKLSQLLKQRSELEQQHTQTAGELLTAAGKLVSAEKEKTELAAQVSMLQIEITKSAAEKTELAATLEGLRGKLKGWVEDQSAKSPTLADYKAKTEAMLGDLRTQIKERDTQILKLQEDIGTTKKQALTSREMVLGDTSRYRSREPRANFGQNWAC